MKSFLESVKTFRVSLRSSSLTGVKVDAETGVLRDVAVMHAGPAKGHGFTLDATSLRQACDLINAIDGGAKIHFKHPQKTEDGQYEDQVGAIVGRLRNCRLDGDAVRGDVHLGEYAKSLPGLGDVWTYLIGVAKDDPTALGLSAVFSWVPDDKAKGVVARLQEMYQVDFVGDPAANPNGLLSEGGEEPAKVNPMVALSQYCQSGMSALRAYLDSSATMKQTTESMGAVTKMAADVLPIARGVTLAARQVIDACDATPSGEPADQDMMEAASLSIRLGNLFARSASECMDSMGLQSYGSSSLAKSCYGSMAALRTARSTLFHAQDAVRPFTSPMASYLSRKHAAADMKATRGK